jgi:hypothetical protein
MKNLLILFGLITAITSCRQIMGDKSFGNHLILLKETKAVVYCADESKPCSEGIHLIENVDDYKSNHDWIIIRTEKDGKRGFWAINKDFDLGDKDCKGDCGEYIKAFVSGPFTYEEFIEALDEWDVGMNLPKE